MAGWADERLGLAKLPRFMSLRKVFPDHWSFMLGEVALWSFVVLLLTGVFLTLWFDPSMAEVAYQGSYDPLRGVPMSAAYASTLNISMSGGSVDAPDAPLGRAHLHRSDDAPPAAARADRKLPKAA